MNGNLEDGKIQQLQYLNDHDVVAKTFFEWSAARHKDGAETTIRRAADVCHVEYWQMRELFKGLADIGVGTYITGRKGWESRLRWLYSIRSVGKAAKREAKLLTDVNAEQGFDDEEKAMPTQSSPHVEHIYKLRPEWTLKLSLPADLSAREAERIAGWIRTLPFE